MGCACSKNTFGPEGYEEGLAARGYHRVGSRSDTVIHLQEPYILTGYRIPPPRYQAEYCLLSVFGFLHNETVNIWTHLLPSLILVCYAVTLAYNGSFSGTQMSHMAVWPACVSLLGAGFCLMCSASFHTLNVHSRRMWIIMGRFDYLGISVFISTALVPLVYYGFYCDPFWVWVYLFPCVSFFIGGITFTLTDIMRKHRNFKIIFFVLFGYSNAVPVSHMAYRYGLWADECCFLWDLAALFPLFALGVGAYAKRFPECIAEGKFDYWGASHQIWHVCVFLSAFVHYYAMEKIATFRAVHGCSMIE